MAASLYTGCCATVRGLAKALGGYRRQAEVALRQANYAEATGDYLAAIAAAQAAIHLGQVAQDVHSEAQGYVQWGATLIRLQQRRLHKRSRLRRPLR